MSADDGAWCGDNAMDIHQDWKFAVRGRDVTARVLVEASGRGKLVSFQVHRGPGQINLDMRVESPKDAQAKVEAILLDMLGRTWGQDQ